MSSDGEEGKRRGGARWMAQSVACTIRRSDAATPILWIAPIPAARCAPRAAVDRTGRQEAASGRARRAAVACLHELRVRVILHMAPCWRSRENRDAGHGK